MNLLHIIDYVFILKLILIQIVIMVCLLDHFLSICLTEIFFRFLVRSSASRMVELSMNMMIMNVWVKEVSEKFSKVILINRSLPLKYLMSLISQLRETN